MWNACGPVVSAEKAAIGAWLKGVAPSTELRKWFGHDPAKWEEFKKRYWEELKGSHDALAELNEYLKKGNVTFVYAAHDEEHNSALALKDFLVSEGFSAIL